jgi:uncharacterized membrane protein
MKPDTKRRFGIIIFTLLIPATAPLVQYIPNPMVPGAIVSLNMIFPILAGYFYGPISGLVVGGAGVWLSALLLSNQFYLTGVFSLALVGALAGWIGRNRRAEVPAAATVILAHAINILVLMRVGLLAIPAERVGVTLLGLTTESVIDMIATVLIIVALKRWLYQTERW